MPEQKNEYKYENEYTKLIEENNRIVQPTTTPELKVHFTQGDAIISFFLFSSMISIIFLVKKYRGGWRPHFSNLIRLTLALTSSWVILISGIDFIFELYDKEVFLKFIIVPPVIILAITLIGKWAMKRSSDFWT